MTLAGVPMFVWVMVAIFLGAICIGPILALCATVFTMVIGFFVLIWGVLVSILGPAWATAWLGFILFLGILGLSILIFAN